LEIWEGGDSQEEKRAGLLPPHTNTKKRPVLKIEGFRGEEGGSYKGGLGKRLAYEASRRSVGKSEGITWRGGKEVYILESLGEKTSVL